MLPLLNSKLYLLPKNERAITQICSLQCSTQRSGRDQITHPTYGHDDLANVIAGVAAVCYGEASASFNAALMWSEPDPPMTDEQKKAAEARRNREWQNIQYVRHLLSGGNFTGRCFEWR
jgi:hypothetical protein